LPGKIPNSQMVVAERFSQAPVGTAAGEQIEKIYRRGGDPVQVGSRGLTQLRVEDTRLLFIYCLFFPLHGPGLYWEYVYVYATNREACEECIHAGAPLVFVARPCATSQAPRWVAQLGNES
jgi:hypothetical protein